MTAGCCSSRDDHTIDSKGLTIPESLDFPRAMISVLGETERGNAGAGTLHAQANHSLNSGMSMPHLSCAPRPHKKDGRLI